jgi:integrase
MVKRIKAQIDTRTSRTRLSPRKATYWSVIERGLAVGYHRPKSGAGTWWVRALVGGGHKVAALGTADDSAQADGETVLNWAQAQAAARAWASKQTAAGPLTVETTCSEYVADLRARKGGRAAGEAEGRFRKHLLPVLGTRQLADLTAADVTAWRNGMVQGKTDEDAIRRSRDSANRMLAMVKAAFNLAFNTGRVVDDRAWRRVQAFKGVGQARQVILSDAELQRLVDACEPGLRELVLTGAWAGTRLGEITAARVRDLDVGKAMLRISGKTGGREIHLPPAPLALLRKLASGKRPDGYLLTTSEGGPWTKSLHTRRFAAAVARAGLDPDTTFYALRHSYISRALVAGVPTKAVAIHCGTSVMMIERYYAKFIPSDQARYAAAAAPELRIPSGSDDRVVPFRAS